MPLLDVNLALPTDSSVVAAQSLSAAVATAYGFAFIGLRLQSRRPSMVVLARAWLLFGAFSASTPIFSDAMLELAPSSPVDAVTFALAMLTVTAFLDAALVITGRRELRTHAWAVGVGFVLEFLRPGQLLASGQPTVFTIVQLLTLTLAGYYMTATAFAQEHAGTMRERIELERRLGRGQRLQSIGRVAGSVAHDFNNVRTAALSATEELADPRLTANERDEAIAALKGAVSRGKARTRQLLDLSRPDRGAVEAFDPGARQSRAVRAGAALPRGQRARCDALRWHPADRLSRGCAR